MTADVCVFMHLIHFHLIPARFISDTLWSMDGQNTSTMRAGSRRLMPHPGCRVRDFSRVGMLLNPTTASGIPRDARCFHSHCRMKPAAHQPSRTRHSSTETWLIDFPLRSHSLISRHPETATAVTADLDSFIGSIGGPGSFSGEPTCHWTGSKAS